MFTQARVEEVIDVALLDLQRLEQPLEAQAPAWSGASWVCSNISFVHCM